MCRGALLSYLNVDDIYVKTDLETDSAVRGMFSEKFITDIWPLVCMMWLPFVFAL